MLAKSVHITLKLAQPEHGYAMPGLFKQLPDQENLIYLPTVEGSLEAIEHPLVLCRHA